MSYDLFGSFAHASPDYIIPDTYVVDVSEKLFNGGLGAIEMFSNILGFDGLCEIIFNIFQSFYE